MKSVFRRLGIFVENKRLLVMLLCLLLIIPAILGAMQLDMKTGYDTMISTDSDVYQDLDRFNQHFSSKVVAILVVGNSDLTVSYIRSTVGCPSLVARTCSTASRCGVILNS